MKQFRGIVYGMVIEVTIHHGTICLSEIFVYCFRVKKRIFLTTKFSNSVTRFVVAVILLGVSSGFTIAHHACQMEQKPCCDSMPSGGPMGLALPSQGPSVGNAGMSCCASTISGGLSNLTALFEKQSKTGDQKLTVIPFHLDFSTQLSHPSTEIRFFTQRTQAASPPSVEKYVLFESLLI